MTELLFTKDCYLREFDASIIFCEGNLIELDRTAFYYASGGQPCDTGRIISNREEYSVIDVYKERPTGKILHKLNRPLDVPGGKDSSGGKDAGGNPDRSANEFPISIHGAINWERRHKHMRYHTALHILSRVVLDVLGNFVTSSQIHEGRARIDFDSGAFGPEITKLIEEKTNGIIKLALPVSIEFLPRVEALKIGDLIRTKVNLVPESVQIIRVISVEGFDRQACGGTHVKNTSEIGALKITKTESKGAERRRIGIVLSKAV